MRLAVALTLFTVVFYSPLLTYVGWPDTTFVVFAAALMSAYAASANPRDASRALLAAFVARAIVLDSRLIGRVLGAQWTVNYPAEYALGVLVVLIYMYATYYGNGTEATR